MDNFHIFDLPNRAYIFFILTLSSLDNFACLTVKTSLDGVLLTEDIAVLEMERRVTDSLATDLASF